MTQRAILAALLALCTALPAFGADLSFSLGATGEYDSNIFRRESGGDADVEDDYIFTIRPGVRLFENHGDDLNYSLSYLVPIEISTRFTQELNDADQHVNLTGDYRVNERISLSLREQFRYLRSTLREDRSNPDEVVAGQGIPAISQERDRITMNSAGVVLNYLFSPRWVGRAAVNSDVFESTRSDRAGNFLVGGVIDSLYRWNQQHQIGGGGRYSYQQFDDREGIPGSNTHTVGLFGSWRWILDETTTLSVNAGPAWLITAQDDASATFTTGPVPFEFVPAGTYSGFFDRDGNEQQNRQVGPRSLLVPTFEVVDGGIQNNCSPGRMPGEFTAPCSGNVLFDSNDTAPGGDAETIAAFRDAANAVVVTNTENGGNDSQRVTIFAEVVLSKRWSPTLGSAFRYSREQGNASGLGGAVVGDSISLSTTWDFFDRWQLAVRGDWIQRQSIFRVNQTRVTVTGIDATDIPTGTANFTPVLAGFDTQGGSAGEAFNTRRRTSIDTNRWSVAGRVTHRLFRSTQVFGQVRYDQQESRAGTLGRSSDFENVLVLIGVQHSFEPIKLW